MMKQNFQLQQGCIRRTRIHHQRIRRTFVIQLFACLAIWANNQYLT